MAYVISCTAISGNGCSASSSNQWAAAAAAAAAIDGAAMAPLWSSIYPQTTVIASIGGNCPTPHGNNTDRRAAAAAPLTDYTQTHRSDSDGN